MTFEEVEKRLKNAEGHAVEPYTQSCSWMGIEISWESCPKKRGAIMKRGNTWGRLLYHDMTGKPITREEAIKDIMKPFDLRIARANMINTKMCAICSKDSQGKNDDWGWLKYMEHGMDICPECKKRIYVKSRKPWKNN